MVAADHEGDSVPEHGPVAPVRGGLHPVPHVHAARGLFLLPPAASCFSCDLYIGVPKMFLYQRMRCGASPGTVLGGVRSHGTLRGRELFKLHK